MGVVAVRRGGNRNRKSWLDRRAWRGKARKPKPKQGRGPSRGAGTSARVPTRGRGRGGVPGPRNRYGYWAVCSHCGKENRAKKLSRLGLGQYCGTRCRVAAFRQRRRAIKAGTCVHRYVCVHCGHTSDDTRV